METFVAIGAAICVAPVALGLIVAKWDRYWSRSGRSGHVGGRGATELV